MASENYKIDISTFFGTARPQLVLELAPCCLFERFGYPLLNDGSWESLGSYVFVAESGDVITINRLANSVWPLFFGLLKKRFWRSRATRRLTICAEKKEVADAFSDWLSAEVRCHVRDWPASC